MTGQSDEDIRTELFMFYYCISDIKKDVNGESVIKDFSQIKVSDMSVKRIKQDINKYSDDNSLYILICFYFLGDCRSEEEHKQCFQNVLVKRKKRIIAAYSKVVL